RDGFPVGFVDKHVHHAGEEPIHSVAAVEFVGQAVVMNCAGIQLIRTVESAAAGQVGATVVVGIGAAPLGQDGGKGGGVVIIIRRAADQDIAAGAGLERRLSGAADQDVSSLSADEPVRAAASHEHIIG